MREKSSNGNGNSDRQQAYVANKLCSGFYAVVAETATIDLESTESRMGQSNHEYDQESAHQQPGPADARPDHQHGAECQFGPGQNFCHPLHGSERQQLVRIDPHREEEVVVTQMPSAIKVKFGVRCVDKNCAEQYPRESQQNAG